MPTELRRAVPPTLAAILVAALALAGAATSIGAQAAAVHKCGTVVVQFEPEGSGGAHNIRARKIACGPARKVARSCIKGTVKPGWTVVNPPGGRTLMTKRKARITYLPVGGGGCGAFQESCGDFGYRGVGFFNMTALGIPCGGGDGARQLAKNWYDQDGCSFGSKCTVKRFRCYGNPKTGTVECVRPGKGFRVTWQMGE
jgi:hypothetical protein